VLQASVLRRHEVTRAGRAQYSLAVMDRLLLDAFSRACSTAWGWILTLAWRSGWARVQGQEGRRGNSVHCWEEVTTGMARPSQHHEMKWCSVHE